MQREQRAWLDGQQKKQEELMQRNQQVQREMVDAVLAARHRWRLPRARGESSLLNQHFRSSLPLIILRAISTCSRGQQDWPEDTWATQLAGLLSGDALDAFTSIPAEAARDYMQVKEAILARFEVNTETYRLCFRSSRCKLGESYKMLLSRQSDQLNRWTQSSGSALKENILLEQFL